MAREDTGAVFTQSGVPVRGSADYQRVFDSRWRFMEIELEYDFEITLPAQGAVPFASRYYEKTTVVRHGLGFVPLFETDYEIPLNPNDATLFADKDKVFIRRQISTSGASAETITGTVRVYNLPVLETYVAPRGLPQGSSSPRSNVGIKFLDGNRAGVDVGDNSPVGFSVDTTKKILSIHRHGLAKINDYIFRPLADVTAIDTTTNILTIDPAIAGTYQTAGEIVRYFPGDFVTYPGGVGTGVYYVIPVDTTHIKLAESYQNALNGVSIDISSAGDLPGSLRPYTDEDEAGYSIYHNVGYPASFIIAEVNRDEVEYTDPIDERTYIGQIIEKPLVRIFGDSEKISFHGIQSIFAGWFGYVILKDPAEIAK